MCRWGKGCQVFTIKPSQLLLRTTPITFWGGKSKYFWWKILVKITFRGVNIMLSLSLQPTDLKNNPQQNCRLGNIGKQEVTKALWGKGGRTQNVSKLKLFFFFLAHLRLYCYFLSPVAVAGSLSLIRCSPPQDLPYVVLPLGESIGRTLHILTSPLGSMWSRQCSFLGRVMPINCLNFKDLWLEEYTTWTLSFISALVKLKMSWKIITEKEWEPFSILQ